MIASSATAGQPRIPSTPDMVPSFICASSVSRGSWACWAMTPSNALTYSSARRISTASETQMPSSENTRTRAAESAIAPSSASRSTCEPDGDRADRPHVAVAGRLAEVPDLLDHTGRVGDRVGVGHRVDRGEATACGRARAGLDRLGVLAAGLAQVGVQVDQAGQGDQPVGVDRCTASWGVVPGSAITPSLQDQVGRRRRRALGRP